jgi:hypothetical protein
MRALCGALIILGSLLGLGLTAVSIGVRYSGVTPATSEGKALFVRFQDLDTALLMILITMMATLLIGIGVAFLGLAYHHERRHHELMSGKPKPVGDVCLPT